MWKSIKFNKQNIEHETGRSILIKLPNKSKLSGWCFWHPAKLVREMNSGKGYWLTFSYTDDFNFKLINNKQEIRMTAKEIEEVFSIMDENITGSNNLNKQKQEESYLVVEEPQKINKAVEVDESLMR